MERNTSIAKVLIYGTLVTLWLMIGLLPILTGSLWLMAFGVAWFWGTNWLCSNIRPLRKFKVDVWRTMK